MEAAAKKIQGPMPMTEQGDHLDFETFVLNYHERAVRIAWRLTGADQATAEDVAQDAFLRAHRGFSSFRNDAKLSSWFYRILVRQALNHHRKTKIREKWTRIWSGHAQTEQAPTTSDPKLRDKISDAMSGLSVQQRFVFTLVHLEGFTVKEAAKIVGCATGTAKSHLHRALSHHRKQLAPQAQENQ